jgi:hypothetical protein
MRKPWKEPKLDDLLDDPIIDVLLQRDGVSKQDVRNVVDEARRKRRPQPERIAC